MDDQRWSRAKELLLQAEGLGPEERRAFLREACGSDLALRREVEALLAADGEAVDFLEASPFPSLYRGPSPESEEIGPYRVLEELGRGGMGVVYLGERADAAHRRKVAIKVLDPFHGGPALDQRFRQEEQILARLEHPNIARFYEGGRTADGRRYFLMEHVEGVPIDRYCEEAGLGLRATLQLFRQVCAAVQYAHQNLVVHRDLKPSNILVTADGEPKLLDFGIAKLLEPPPGQTVAPTAPEERFLTLEHASPEQVRGEPVSAASDVYSLGVLLHHLLTGRSPYGEWDSTAELRREVLSESAPLPPSEALQPQGGASFQRWRKRLRGDLDRIVSKALQKEPGRRYGSAEQLADDVERFLRGQPVTAQPDSLPYRLGKFWQRNRLPVSLAAVVAVALLVGAALLAWQRGLALQERDRSNAISSFLIGLFESADPEALNGAELSVKDLVDLGAQRLRDDLHDQPEVRASLSSTLGTVYMKMGANAQAEALYREALALAEATASAESLEAAEVRFHLGLCISEAGDTEAALPELEESLRVRRKILGDDHPKVAEALAHVAYLEYDRGHYDQAAELQEEALGIRRRSLGPDHQDIAESLKFLALIEESQGQADRAAMLLEESLGIYRRTLGEGNASEAMVLHHLARILSAQGEWQKAEEYQRRVNDLFAEIYGQEHPAYASGLNSLGVMLRDRGRLDEALPMALRVLEIRERLFGLDNVRSTSALHNLGRLYTSLGRYEEAEENLLRALEINQRHLRETHPRIATNYGNLGDLYRAWGKYEQGGDAYQRAIAIFQAEGHARLPRIQELYAELREEQRAASQP